MTLKPLDEVIKTINKLPPIIFVIVGSAFIIARKTTVIWNHDIVMRLFYSSFQICEFCILLIFIVFAYLIYLIVNKYIKKQNFSLSLKNFLSIRHQIIASINPNSGLTRNLDDKYN